MCVFIKEFGKSKITLDHNHFFLISGGGGPSWNNSGRGGQQQRGYSGSFSNQSYSNSRYEGNQGQG